MRIVETDNHGSDFPNERFVNLPSCCEIDAERIAAVINDVFCRDDNADRFWKVVENNYQLQPGFEP